MLVINNRFKIKTKDGYRRFAGIAESDHSGYFVISFSNGSSVRCSGKHKFWDSEHKLIKAKYLTEGMELITATGLSKINFIDTVEANTRLFDIIEIDTEDNHFFLANDLKTHNCQFIVADRMLIDADVLDFYKIPEPLDEINGFRIFKDKLDHVDGLLVITIDPSGGGEDASCIKIFEIAPQKVYEIASLADEDANASVIFEKLLWLQEFMKTRWGYQPDESLIIFERNGVGEGLAQILTHTEKAIENLEMPIFYDHKGKAGLHMTPTMKAKLALQFKNLIEYNRMVISDGRFLDELYGYVRFAGGNYAAKSGYHDDHVSAALLMVYYLLNEFANYAIGDFSVDSVMLTNPEEKIVNTSKEETDPAMVYRERMNQQKVEDEKLIAEAKLKLEEEKKRQELEYYAHFAQSSMSVVEEDDDSDLAGDWDIVGVF